MPFGLCIWSTGVGPTEFTQSLPFAKTQVGRIAVDEFLRVLAPPKQDHAGGAVRAEGEAGAGAARRVTPLTDESPPLSPAPGSVRAEAAEYARLRPVPDVYALGDCCANPHAPLPALAQVAEQQGRYLAAALNRQAREAAAAGGGGAGGGSGSSGVGSSSSSGSGGSSGRSGAADAPLPPFEYKHMGSMATVGGTSAILELGSASSRRLSLAGFASWVAWRSAYLTRLGSLRNRMRVVSDWLVTMLLGRDLSRW